jgi:cytochrome c peroxidase
MKLTALGGALFLVGACTTSDSAVDYTGTPFEALQTNQNLVVPNNIPILDPTGFGTTFSTANGGVDFSGDFFQSLGTNGRRCVSCHVPTSGWTITPPQLQLLFDLTGGGEIQDGLGLSAIFRTNDGTNSPNADVSTVQKRRQAYSMLLSKGVIRIGLPIPAGAEYTLIDVQDPYGFASASQLSLFRRPPSTANIADLSTVMWDGRENHVGEPLTFDLDSQADDATTTHAQGSGLSQAQEDNIVDFATNTWFAQEYDFHAGDLTAAGAIGGADEIPNIPFHIGINDNFGDCDDPACEVIGAPLGVGFRDAPFNPIVMTLYSTWSNLTGRNYNANRAAVARGETLFNTFPINISGVGGLNDNPAFGSPANLVGGCVTCHDTPNMGNHSVAAPLNIGLVDDPRFQTPDLPLYTFQNNTTGAIKVVTDPGRGLITGKWINLGEFKGPVLRGLAARAPYFHNGFAADLDAVVTFYNTRFDMNLTTQQHNDLVAFLRTL